MENVERWYRGLPGRERVLAAAFLAVILATLPAYAFGIGFATGGVIGVLLARPLARFVRDAETRGAIRLIQLGFLPLLIGGAVGYVASGNDGRALGGGIGGAIGVVLISTRLARGEGLHDGGQRPRSGGAPKVPVES